MARRPTSSRRQIRLPDRPDPATPGHREKPVVDAELDEPEYADDDGANRRRWILSRNAKSRLDKYLQNRVKAISRSQIQKLIGLGGVTVNGKSPKASTALHKGDVVEVILPPRPAVELEPQPIPLDVLYEDEHMIVVNKQRGLIVHPARSHLSGTLLNALAHHFMVSDPERAAGSDARRDDPRQQVGPPARASMAGDRRPSNAGLSRVGADDARPGIVHRLDMNTTGVIVVAKQDQTHWLLARQFEARSNLKVYLAVVHGCPDPPGGAIEQPIGKHPTIHPAMAVRHNSTARQSLTLYRLRERYRGYSLVELELKTGRTHQARVHMSYSGLPLVGDILYGGEPVGPAELVNPPAAAGSRPNLNFARDRAEGQRFEQATAARDDLIMATAALHATLLRIRHPVTGKDMTFVAPVHAPMRQLILELRKRTEPGPVVTEGFWIDLGQIVGR